MKKRPFILLEALIAISILSLCIVPLAYFPYRAYKTELHLLQSLELERMADVVAQDIYHKMQERFQQQKAFAGLVIPPITVDIPHMGTFTYQPRARQALQTTENALMAKIFISFVPIDSQSVALKKEYTYCFVFQNSLPKKEMRS